MLPIVWFYIVAVTFLLGLLVYTELRKQVRGHVKGCSNLLYISPQRLNSLIIIEPDLKILELGSRLGRAGIPDANQIPAGQLEGYLSHVSRSAVLVFYASVKDPVDWKQLELLVRKYSMRNVFILCGGLEAWLTEQGITTPEAVGSSTQSAG
jgi:hypothetical protein